MNDPIYRGRAAAWPPILFHLGRVVATPAALRLLEAVDVSALALLHRHERGDFGNLCDDDKASNLAAIHSGARILSAYELGPRRDRVWVLTEACDDSGSRQSTCVLLPSEY